MKSEKMYMHIHTGSVGTEAEWKADFDDAQKDEETKVDQTFAENFSENFCEVEKDADGDWIAVKE